MTSTELILKTCKLPPTPVVAMKLLRLVNEPTSNVNDLQNLIAADQALTSHVLKIANSAYYGLPRVINTISDAIFIIGFDVVKMLTLAVSTKEVYKTFGIVEQKLWEHNMGVSIASGLIAHEVKYFKPEEAVVAGLLHDIGKAVMYDSQPVNFGKLMCCVFEKRIPFYRLEKDFFGFGHAEVGGLLAEEWGFPGVLCDVIRDHHSSPQDILKKDANELALCASVALADLICVRLGVGYRGPMADMDFSSEKLMDILDVSEEKFQVLIERFKEIYIKQKSDYQV